MKVEEKDDLLVYFVKQISIPQHTTGLSVPKSDHPPFFISILRDWRLLTQAIHQQLLCGKIEPPLLLLILIQTCPSLFAKINARALISSPFMCLIIICLPHPVVLSLLYNLLLFLELLRKSCPILVSVLQFKRKWQPQIILWYLGTIPLSSNEKAISCKLVFRVKVNLDGAVARLKARIVSQGYAQT